MVVRQILVLFVLVRIQVGQLLKIRPIFRSNILLISGLLLSSITFCQVREPWVHHSKAQWPAIALVNDVLYKNGDRHQDPSVSYVGTGFLLNTGNDTFAVTVKHALYAARNNKTDRVVVNKDLRKWKMYPKNKPEDSVIIGHLINEDSTEMLFSQFPGKGGPKVHYPELVGFHILLAEAHMQNKDYKKAAAVLVHAPGEVYEEDKAGLRKLIDELRTK